MAKFLWFFVITFFKEVKKHSSVVFHKEEKSVKSTFRWNCALCSLIQFDIFSSFLSPLTSAAHAHFDSDYCKKTKEKKQGLVCSHFLQLSGRKVNVRWTLYVIDNEANINPQNVHPVEHVTMHTISSQILFKRRNTLLSGPELSSKHFIIHTHHSR